MKSVLKDAYSYSIFTHHHVLGLDVHDKSLPKDIFYILSLPHLNSYLPVFVVVKPTANYVPQSSTNVPDIIW